jgi:DNA-binding FadR family transcriptional regulator
VLRFWNVDERWIFGLTFYHAHVAYLAQEEELRAGSLSRKYDMEFHRLVSGACHNPVQPVQVIDQIEQDHKDPEIRKRFERELHHKG